MSNIKRIIMILDEALVSSKKSFLTLQQCNKILLENGVFSENDITNKTLKRYLEVGLIKNAYQTPHAPKHWRIVHLQNSSETDEGIDETSFIVEADSKNNSTREHIFCPTCGNPIPLSHDNRNNLFIKCPSCSNTLTNPGKTQSLKKRLNRFYDRYGLKVVLVAVILTIISIVFIKIKFDKRYQEWNNASEKEILKRIELLKNLARDVFREHGELYTDWAIISRLQQVQETDYRNKDIYVELYSKESKNGEILIYSSKLIIPNPTENAIKDKKYGIPLSFFYQFYFDNQDILTKKYLVVVYDSDSIVQYNFSESPFKLLINKTVAKRKNDAWEKERQRLANQQKKNAQKINTQQPAQSKSNSSSSTYYRFRSNNFDIEKPGQLGYTTVNEKSFHTINLSSMTVKQTSLLNGEWVEITYSIKRFYYEEGALSTTYVLVINSNGLKEVWFCPETNSLGYDYMDGTRIACYDLRVVE